MGSGSHSQIRYKRFHSAENRLKLLQLPQLIMENQPPQPLRSDDPEFRDLVRRKNSLSIILSLLIFSIYFGFIGLMAFSPKTLSSWVGSATLGIPVGIGVIILAWILTGIYVSWANGAYDTMVARVKSKR
jgi:uncharacterized membrane protein (DUF485 family)